MIIIVQKWKLEKVEDIRKQIEAANAIGIVDVSGLPAATLQNIKKSMRGSAEIMLTKKSVILKAIEASEKKKANIKELENLKAHIPAIVIGKDNPFKLYKKLEKMKEESLAKAGDVAPHDIVVPEGPTNLPPGPAIADLQKAGLKAAIQGQNIVIRETSTIVKQGAVITDIVAGVLAKLDIKPMEIGMNVLGFYEGGTVYGKDILAVDESEYVNQIVRAYRNGFNLAYNANYFTKDVVALKLVEAYRNAMNLGINAEVFEKEIIPHLLAKANLQAISVKQVSKFE